MRLLASLLLVCFFLAPSARGQTFSRDIDNAWEPEEGTPLAHVDKSFSPVALLLGLSENLVKIYKRDVSVNSISRCPFEVSCSNFARDAIARHGLIGFLMFIDRYYYRENVDSFYEYPLVDTGDGVLKLDDNFFLR